MSTTTNSTKQILFAERPAAGATPDPNTTFKLVSTALPALDKNQLLVKSVYLSLDPAMRGWMNDARSYVTPLQIGEVMRGAVVGVVLESRSAKFQANDIVLCVSGWTELAVVDAHQAEKLSIPQDLALSSIHSLLGMTAMTAFFGLLDVGKPVPGDTVVVSGAAGATGMIVAQIAKLMGCRVVAIAGGRSKCDFLEQTIGVDRALDYLDADFKQHFKEATPGYVNVYFDNVGGEILDMVLTRLATHARIVLCGAISQYNSAKPQGPANYGNLIAQKSRMEGFIVFEYAHRYADARKRMIEWYQRGLIKVFEQVIEQETTTDGKVLKGVEAAPFALGRLWERGHKDAVGKLLVQISAPPASSSHL